MRRVLFVLCTLFIINSVYAQQPMTYRQHILWLQKQYKVHFIYDANLDLDIAYSGDKLDGKGLLHALKTLFKEGPFEYQVIGNNIILKQRLKQKERVRKLTLFGTVVDEKGEALINASVFDLMTQIGVLSDERGRYSLLLNPGEHQVAVSYAGQSALIDTLVLTSSTRYDIQLKPLLLNEIVVTADLNDPLLTTQTGKYTLTDSEIKTEYALLSSPDLVKTIQRISGVNNGIELSSGMYVHGGGADENLYLLDGTPVYQINHSLGLFSAFNADIIKNVDFYKSGFPARYSGRLSSVTDIRTRDGDMQNIRGSFSVGLLDGRFQLEGPIQKDKTSFNVSLRRSWIDLLSKPIFGLLNAGKKNEHYSMDYLFQDLNVRVTHNFLEKHVLWLSMYMGKDRYAIRDKFTEVLSVSDTDNQFKWGNRLASLGADLQLSSKLSSSVILSSSDSQSLHGYDESDYTEREDGVNSLSFKETVNSDTRLHDFGAKLDFRWRISQHQQFRFGASANTRRFTPQTKVSTCLTEGTSEEMDTTSTVLKTKAKSSEITVYAEDDLKLQRKLSINIGFSHTLFHAHGVNYQYTTPRLAMNYQASDYLSAKLSYSRMSQSIHRLATTFLEFPTDYWAPITSAVKPSECQQIAGGIYLKPTPSVSVSLEGFWKSSENLIQYKKWMGLQPTASQWQQDVTQGKGRSYGLELSTDFKKGAYSAQFSYTLSWSKRYFPEIFNTWFYDQFDNRHKLDVVGRYKPSDKLSVYCAWTMHSGNRVSLPEQIVQLPGMPGKFDVQQTYIYSAPNNSVLPLYHRLDLGADLFFKTSKGREYIWNISVYNAYCHLNTMYVEVKQTKTGTWKTRCKGYVPIIPSLSYTIKF